jgi:hypothetical protein
LKKVFSFIITLIQVFMIIPPVVLQYYSGRRMGMMRYLVYEKGVFTEGVFSPGLMNIYKVILVISIVYFISFLIRNHRKSMQNSHMAAIILGLVISLFGMIFMFLPSLQDLLAYHFFLIAIFIQVILQAIRTAFYGRN